jgi:predicted ATPase/DNA-binding XRE family transcriptional regulator
VAFADLLIELRIRRGLSQEVLAERAGVSVRAISDLERGITGRPHRRTVQALADGLGITGAERTRFEEAAAEVAAPLARGRAAPQIRLPAPISSIIGRYGDLAALSRLLRTSNTRLVTITGPGGVGKSRLAAEVGWRTTTGFERVDGLDLSSLRTPDDVAGALATALGCHTGTTDPARAVALLVGDRPWLLVLDSFEHVLDAGLGVVELLGRCPRLRLLVTSRAPLRLRGEHLWPLAPLPVPTGSEVDLAALGEVPAVELFVERVRAVRPGFSLTEGNAAVLAHVCRRLEGLPLALELAAAQLRTLDPVDLMAQLDGQLSALRADAVDVPDRQRTLRSTVEWSLERLGGEHHMMLSILSIFAGGAAPAMVREVLTRVAMNTSTLDAAVSVLATTSMVTVEDRAGAPRVAMLDTVREVAGDLLRASGRWADVCRAHAEVFCDLLRDAAAGDLSRIDAELDNVRAGLAWAIGNEPALVDAGTVEAFSQYCLARSRFREAYRVLVAVAEVAPDATAGAHALRGAGLAANEYGDHATALRLAQRSAALFEELGDAAGRCAALTVSGNAYKILGDYAAAEAAYQTSLDLALATGDQRRVTVALNNLGTLAHDRAEHDLARRYYRESLEVKDRIGDQRGIAVTRMNLGAVANDVGEYVEARAHLDAAVATFRARGEQHALGYALVLLAEADAGLGDHEAARRAATEALAIARTVEHGPTIGLALSRLGDVAVATGHDQEAEDLYQEALTHDAGPPEVARTLERLAAVRVRTAPDEARKLLASADETRRSHGAPPPPADRALLDRTRRGTAGR